MFRSLTSSETQGQLVGTGKSLKRAIKNSGEEKSRTTEFFIARFRLTAPGSPRMEVLLITISFVQKLASKPCTGTTAGEKRTLVAHEILSTEVTYMNALSIIQDVFKKPLQASLASNRCIILHYFIQSLVKSYLSLVRLCYLSLLVLQRFLK